MAGFKNGLKRKKKNKVNTKGIIGTGFLSKITPKKGYDFRSDYFMIDDSYATILTVFIKEGADRNLVPMWGVNLLPRNIGTGVTARLLTQITRADDAWVQKHQNEADTKNQAQMSESNRSQKSKERRLTEYRTQDLDVISSDLISGDKYHWVTFKELVKAPTLEDLDAAVARIQRNLDKVFGGMYVGRYQGQQRDDLTNLLRGANKQLGKKPMFTSSELAGEYNIVTQGINDDFGEYVGIMKGDINNNAVLWDVDDFHRNVIVASDDNAATLSDGVSFPKNTRGAAMWGVNLAQNALIDNHRVVHLVLDESKVGEIGINLNNITTYVDMQKGAINPFEMFGDPADELSIFPAQLNKIELMAKQISPSLTDIDLNKHLNDLLTDFYVDLEMWHDNAKDYRDSLRVVGLPHKQYPLLQKFNSYLEQRRKEASDANIISDITSIERLQSAFTPMLNTNGDLFDQYTDPSVDGSLQTQQVVYDFSKLLNRSSRIMMAQFVNAIGFAVGNLDAGDLLIIHGMELLDPEIHEYFKKTIQSLYRKNVRVAFLYDSIEEMFNQADLNNLTDCDWMLTGTMSQSLVDRYQKILGLRVPKDLIKGLTTRDAKTYFLRRGAANTLFDADLVLDKY